MQRMRWQARKMIAPARPVICSAGDTVVRLYPDGQIAELVWLDCFEHAERDFIAAYARRGMHVFNIGANIGLYSILASLRVGPDGKVHAFEPSTETYARLMRNLRLNGCDNVTAVQLALADTRSKLLLRADPKNPLLDGHRFVESPSSTKQLLASDELVQAVTLDDYIAGHDALRIDFIVMDVEGAELAVLRGGRESLSRFGPTILLECSRHQKETEDLLRKLGYGFWTWNTNEQSLVPANFEEVVRRTNVIARQEGWSACQ